LNYLNLTEKNWKPRFVKAIYNYSDDDEYSYSEEDVSSSSPSTESESDFVSDNGDGEVNDFFKSFTHSNFIEKNESRLDLTRTVMTPSGEQLTVNVGFGVDFFRPFF
jgi:hypothetical protein